MVDEPTHLSGAYKKIERARTHLTELEDAVIEYMARPPYARRHTDKGGVRKWWVQAVDPAVPDVISLALGDMIHNLRSALDLLVCQYVLAGGGKVDTSSVEFPIKQTEQLVAKALDSPEFTTPSEIAGTPVEGVPLTMMVPMVPAGPKLAIQDGDVWLEGPHNHPQLDDPEFAYSLGVNELDLLQYDEHDIWVTLFNYVLAAVRQFEPITPT